MYQNCRQGIRTLVYQTRSMALVWHAALCAAWLLGCASTPLTAETLYVAPAGNDSAAGTRAAPLASVEVAVNRLSASGGEVVLLEGRYTEFVKVLQPEDVAGEVPRLVIRAAEGAQVTFDGSRPLADARPLEDAPGVYVIEGRFREMRPPTVWEQGTRQRYQNVADLAAVKRFVRTHCVIDGNRLVFHTTGGKAPRAVNARMSRPRRSAIQVRRDNVTIRGVRFENYLGSRWAAGAQLRADGGIVERCHAFNCYRGWIAGGNNNVIQDSTAVDVGTGVYAGGTNVTIKGCRFQRIRDSFMIRKARGQDDAGFHLYYPGHDAIVRNNVFIGFELGVSIKCKPGREVVEHNTLIGRDGRAGVFFSRWEAQDVVRQNVMAGFRLPAVGKHRREGHGLNGATFNRNLLWHHHNAGEHRRMLEQFKGEGAGENNTFARPEFVAPDHDDYRPAAASPAVRLTDSDDPAGALPIAPDQTQQRAPTLSITPESPVRTFAAWGKKLLENDPWNGGGQRVIEKLKAQQTQPQYATATRDLKLAIDAEHVDPDNSELQYRINTADPTEAVFSGTLHLTLPDTPGAHDVAVRVRERGEPWSQWASVSVTLWRSLPKLKSAPRARRTRHGLVLDIQTDRPVAASMRLRPAEESAPSEAEPAAATTRTWSAQAGGVVVDRWFRPLTTHTLAVSGSDLKPGATYRAWLVLKDPAGQVAMVDGGTYTLQGEARTWHVSPKGRDAWGRGDADAPLRTLQAALDRALPGDTVRLTPGIYPGPAQLDHGGLSGAPITIEARELDTAYLDSAKREDVLLRLNNAPHVVVRNLNVRWFKTAGISVSRSAHVTIERCRFINKYWSEWPEGTGVLVSESLHVTVTGCTIARCQRGIVLRGSPHASLDHNSITACMLAGLWLVYSDEGVTITNNAFCYAGNVMMDIVTSRKRALASSARIDFNNYGTGLREKAMRTEEGPSQNIQPNHEYLIKRAKGVIGLDDRNFYGLTAWQKATGLDKHSIFAPPRWVDPRRNDWRLMPESPMRGAGENGTDIGATGYQHPGQK